jgi:uncharacterized membrane-anchored protein
MRQPSSTHPQLANDKWAYLTTKVPRLTVFFWVIKILTTGSGEATSDFLAHQFNPFVAVAIGGVAFALSLVLQLRTQRYVAWIYWLCVSMVSVFGTMAADGLHVELHVPYYASTALYSVGLAVVLSAWYITERTISIHSINTVRRELFYWATVLATFALGTALGDLTATTFHLGYFASGVVFAVAFAIPGLAYWKFRVHPILCFWVAYILTRPLGASFADWMGVPHNLAGGLNFGRGHVALVGGALILALVLYVQFSRIDVQEELPQSS